MSLSILLLYLQRHPLCYLFLKKKRARAEVKVNVSHFEAKNKLSTL